MPPNAARKIVNVQSPNRPTADQFIATLARSVTDLDSFTSARHLSRRDADLPLQRLIAPIAAATVVTAFWFAAMWRAHQLEIGGGKLPWPYQVAFFGYLIGAGLVLYLTRDKSLTTGVELFGAAAVSEGLGIVITYAVLQAFVLSREQPWSERATPMFFAVMLMGGMIAAVLTT